MKVAYQNYIIRNTPFGYG